ncbi:MAG: sulfotransferase family protein [Loktanella sp.]|nr:sulfotransferase family protein [Loktanella sp.]
MIVFDEKKLVVFAVPKTGSTSIENAIGNKASLVVRRPPVMKHMPVGNYKRFFKPMDQEFGRDPAFMAVVRHPVDWLGSWYRYRFRDALIGQPNSTRGHSFDDFVTEYCRPDPAPCANVGSQFRFVMIKRHTEIGVDHLFRYEAQEAIRNFLVDRLGFDFKLPRLNVSEKMALTLSPAVEARLREAKADEFWIWDQARTTAQP